MPNLKYQIGLTSTSDYNGPWYNVLYTTASGYNTVLSGSPAYLPNLSSFAHVEIPSQSFSYLAFRLVSSSSFCDNSENYTYSGSVPGPAITSSCYAFGTGITGGLYFNQRGEFKALIDPYDESLIVYGDTSPTAFTYSGSITKTQYLFKANNDGTANTTEFTGTTNFQIEDLIPVEEGKYIMVGDFTSYSGSTRNKIAKVNNDGTIDDTWSQVTTGFNQDMYSVIYSNGGYIVGGAATYYGFYSIPNRIIKLLPSGAVDTSFQHGAGTAGTDVRIKRIKSYPGNERMMVLGDFHTWNATSSLSIGLVRLNSDGTRDTSFNTATYMDYIADIGVQSTGKIVAYTQNSGFNGLIRLNPDGTNDTTFSSPQFFYGYASEPNFISIQSDDKILISGQLIYSSSACLFVNIARFNPDGTPDLGFQQNSTTSIPYLYLGDTYHSLKNNGRIVVSNIWAYDNLTSGSGAYPNTINGIIELDNSGSLYYCSGSAVNEWYALINCTTTSASYSEMYSENTFEINDRVTSGSATFRVDGIINYNPGGALTPISSSGFTGCPTPTPTPTPTPSPTPTVYTYLINRDPQATGPDACTQYAGFNRASAYSYQSSITTGTYLYTDNTQMGNPAYYVPDGYYSNGTKYFYFSGGNTGTTGTNC